MPKIMMKIGNHNFVKQPVYNRPNNQVIFGLNGRRNSVRKLNNSKSCSSCIPPPSNSFDTILQNETEQHKRKQQQVIEQRNKEEHERELHTRKERDREQRDREQRDREQRDREQRDKEQRERKQREREQHEREQRERKQREREQREREQRERKQREKEHREREQREREQREREHREREQREREQREREQREREQREREQPKEKELGEVFAESPTSVLTNDFDSRVMQSNKHVLLLMYAPWCGWCKRIAPDFIKATQDLQSNSEVELMVIDATQHQVNHPKVQLQGFPTVILFKKDDKANPMEYSGDRSAGDMVNFVNTHIGGMIEAPKQEPSKEKELGEVFAESPTSVLTNDFDSRVMQSNKHVLLLFYAPWCGWCKRIAPDFIKATQELQGNSEVELMVVDATQHQITHPKVQIRGFPTMFLFKKDDKANPVEYRGDRSVDDMVNFVNTHAGGKVESPKQEPPKEKELGEVFAESPTSVLTNDFDSRVMQSNKHILLLFYAPWCGWCKRIAPDFIKATQELQGNSEVELMVVDATQHQIAHPKVQIQGFPTMFLFKKDDKANPVEYNGDRSTGDMVNFVNTHAGGKVEPPKQEPPKEKELGEVFAESPTSVLTNDFDLRVLQSNKHVLLLFYAPWCGWCKRIAPDFIKATQELQGNSEVELMVVDATQHQIAHPKVQIQGFPTMFLFKKDDKANPVEYNGDRSTGDMVNFVNTHAGGKVEPPKQEPPKEKELGEVFAESPTSVLTNDFEVRVMHSNKHVLMLMYAPWCGWCKRIAPDFIKATQDLQSNSEVELMVIDATQHQVNHPNVQLQGFPTVILFKKDDKANPIEYSGDRSAGDIVNFVNTQTNSPNIQLKVQEVSGGNGSPINITDNFKQLVVDSPEDVIVMFYAPWCGWCKKMLPDYDRLASHFKEHSSKLKVMKIDATAHQVQHDNVKIYGFPLLHYFKAGDKQNPIEYKGNRSFDDMVNYINSNKTF